MLKMTFRKALKDSLAQRSKLFSQRLLRVCSFIIIIFQRVSPCSSYSSRVFQVLIAGKSVLV